MSKMDLISSCAINLQQTTPTATICHNRKTQPRDFLCGARASSATGGSVDGPRLGMSGGTISENNVRRSAAAAAADVGRTHARARGKLVEKLHPTRRWPRTAAGMRGWRASRERRMNGKGASSGPMSLLTIFFAERVSRADTWKWGRCIDSYEVRYF